MMFDVDTREQVGERGYSVLTFNSHPSSLHPSQRCEPSIKLIAIITGSALGELWALLVVISPISRAVIETSLRLSLKLT